VYDWLVARPSRSETNIQTQRLVDDDTSNTMMRQSPTKGQPTICPHVKISHRKPKKKRVFPRKSEIDPTCDYAFRTTTQAVPQQT